MKYNISFEKAIYQIFTLQLHVWNSGTVFSLGNAKQNNFKCNIKKNALNNNCLSRIMRVRELYNRHKLFHNNAPFFMPNISARKRCFLRSNSHFGNIELFHGRSIEIGIPFRKALVFLYVTV